jgi:PAS domain S-box-containing protein
MESHRTDASSPLIGLNSVFSISIAAVLTGVLCYVAAKLGGAMVLRPQMVWPLWPGCALLIAILLLCPRRSWGSLIAAGLAGFVANDVFGFGLTLRFSGTLILADTVEVLVAALGIRYFFGNVARLNSPKSLAKYLLIAVILAPVLAAFVSAAAFTGRYWVFWKIGVFEEGLAVLTVTPAILGLMQKVLARGHQPLSYYVEAATLMLGLVVLGRITFVSSAASHPELLYSLVPLLLWSALRFGVTGTSVSITVVAFLSIWGVVHGHGPFVGTGTINDVVSLQLFLLVAATSFMFLAAVVEGDKQVQEVLRRTEEQFRIAAQAGRMFAYDWDLATDVIVRSGDVASVLGPTAEVTLSRQQLAADIHPDDKTLFSDSMAERTPENPDFQTSYRLLRPDGSVQWLADTAHVFFDENGDMTRVVGMVADITERKRAEQALAEVSRKMVEVQEEERARIARDLHDDINQRLALLAVEIELLGRDLPNDSAEMSRRLTEVWQRITEVSTEVQSISHQLHSPQLEILGIGPAMRSFCRGFSARQRVEVDFKSDDMPRSASHAVSLCLFRVLQEALHNAAKHSKVRHFEVRLGCVGDELYLTVSDGGAGFDMDSATMKGGLGLISIRERVRLVNGSIAIESKPTAGTTIRVRVPLEPAPDAQPAAV